MKRSRLTQKEIFIIQNNRAVDAAKILNRPLGTVYNCRKRLKNRSAGIKAAETRKTNEISSKTLSFVINGLNLQMDNRVKNVMIGLNSIKIDF